MYNMVTLLTAIISAIALLSGYIYQKYKEREAEIRKKRQEIYSRFIVNLTERQELFEQAMRGTDWPNREDSEYSQKLTKLIIGHSELNKNFSDGREIMTFLSLYGSDEAIEACLEFRRAGWEYSAGESSKGADIGKLIRRLRRSVYPKTRVTSEDLNLVMWKGVK